jgi:phage-related protein
MVPLKKIVAHFYATGPGEEPVRAWLRSLDEDARRVVGKDIQKVEFGWPIGLPVCRPLGDGLWEVRSDLSDGRSARVLFGFFEGTMVLLHGFIKKTQKTPKPDRDLALKRLRSIAGRERKTT